MEQRDNYGDDFTPELSPIEKMQEQQEMFHDEIRSGIKWLCFFAVLYFIIN